MSRKRADQAETVLRDTVVVYTGLLSNSIFGTCGTVYQVPQEKGKRSRYRLGEAAVKKRQDVTDQAIYAVGEHIERCEKADCDCKELVARIKAQP